MKPIYLDYMATTPLDPLVKESMLEFLGGIEEDLFGNTNSLHYYGRKAKEAIENARIKVANLVSCSPHSILWTSGATEANNLAIKGAADFYRRQGNHIITSTIEHSSVLACCRHLETQGFEVSYVQPSPDGLVEPHILEKEIRRETILISLMHANNEIGTIQDIAKIGAIAKDRGILLHVDAAQSLGKIAIDLVNLPVDLMSFSAHKIYGPKGAGALYIRSNPRLHLTPQIHGGPQESNLRAGTLATHQIVGMGEACYIAGQRIQEDGSHQRYLLNLLSEAATNWGNITINGSTKYRLPNNLNISIGGIDHKPLIDALEDIAISATAACHDTQPSHVLKAIGVTDRLINNSLRISIGRFTTEEEINYVIAYLGRIINQLQEITR